MTLTTIPKDPLLDLDPWVGQRQCTFRFERVDAVSGAVLADVTPLRQQGRESTTGQFGNGYGASISHDTTRTIKRQMTLSFGVEDTADINPLTERISVFMVFPNGQEYPLGRYMFTDASRQLLSDTDPGDLRRLGNMTLSDEMFLVDQQVTTGVSGVGRSVTAVIQDVLAGLPVAYNTEASPFISSESWFIGTSRGQILDSLALTGDYFSPWFDHGNVLRFIRSFDASDRVADLDFDYGNKVLLSSVLETDDLLTAPNRFVVVSNFAEDLTAPIVGTFDIAPSAANSIENRGFVIANVQSLQITDVVQATAVAQNLAQRNSPFTQVGVVTAPDPRHDSYNVIQWQGEKWLELAWTMELEEGGAMSHRLRRAYGGSNA